MPNPKSSNTIDVSLAIPKTTMITCRRATEDDALLFKTIRLRALLDSPEAFGSTYESALERDQQSWQEQINTTVSGPLRNTQFAFNKNECIGIAALYRQEGATQGDIIMMWISPQHRGTNAATLIVSKLIEWARESNFKTVHLNVTDTNQRAINFYKKCGFTQTEENVEVDYCRGLQAIRMQKILQFHIPTG